ncbi:hypothetical protein HU200_038449 [Digitaria exilis]|uniref:Uncharacterized protein n=1 Tax=Digitaria exilis TaxID=1010633 RepID=A0A835BBX3_9POAL|nr:hypothetical protein HU200_038449 [Digitaria exilis]
MNEKSPNPQLRFDDSIASAMEKKWRMPQDHVGLILSWDVTEYVPRAPDNIDHLPVSQEVKDSYRAAMLRSIADMREIRRSRKELQDGIRAELEKNGYVQVETTAEQVAKYQHELEQQGFVEIKAA